MSTDTSENNKRGQKRESTKPLTHVAVDPVPVGLGLGDDAVGAEVVGLLAAEARARAEDDHPPVRVLAVVGGRGGGRPGLGLVDGVPHHALHLLLHLVEHAPESREVAEGPVSEISKVLWLTPLIRL